MGSVAEEAARLIGLLSAGLSDAEARAAGARASARTGVCETCGRDATTDTSAPPGSRAEPLCHLCPICQLLAIVRSISPETIERLADVVDMLCLGLRGVADSRRAAGAPPSAPSGEQTDPVP